MKKPLFCTLLLIGMNLLSACQSTKVEPEPRYVPNIVLGDAQILYITGERAACVSDKPMQCLIAKPENGSSFGISYDGIAGFEPKIGTSYKIIARPKIDQNHGQATGLWQLEEILLQQAQP